mmetsp:Transcript_140674/g.245015  ORF Transcript_140674/g.245015 Transcript_140674/m.245015 type:complete len:161 (+) Transcript_140674:387-869(+)
MAPPPIPAITTYQKDGLPDIGSTTWSALVPILMDAYRHTPKVKQAPPQNGCKDSDMHTHTHTHARARVRACTHAHTQCQCMVIGIAYPPFNRQRGWQVIPDPLWVPALARKQIQMEEPENSTGRRQTQPEPRMDTHKQRTPPPSMGASHRQRQGQKAGYA